MESFGFELKLVSDVDRVAKRGIDPLKKLEIQAEKTKDALSRGFAGSWNKIGMAADRAAFKQRTSFADMWQKIGFTAEKSSVRQQTAHERAAARLKNAFSNSWAKIGMAADRTQKRQHEMHRKLEERAERLKEKNSFMGGMKEAVGFEKLASAAFLGSLLADSLIEGAHKAVEIVTDGVKEAFNAGAKHEQLRLSYRLMRGQEGGKEAMEDQERFAEKTPYTGSEVGEMMRPLYNAKMDPKAARQAFATAEDLQAKLGGDINGYIEMMAKIKNKGGVSEKMLIGLGVGVQDFYAAVAKATGTKGKAGKSAIEEAKKNAAADKINPQILLNALTEAVNKQQGGAAGTGGEMMSKTMGARLHKLSMLPELYLEKLDETPAWTAISDKFEALFKALDPEGEQGERIMGSLVTAFSKIEGLVEAALKPDSIDAFVVGIQKAVQTAGMLVSTLQAAIDLINGETLSHGAFGDGDSGDAKVRAIKAQEEDLKNRKATGAGTEYAFSEQQKEIDKMRASLTPSERADYEKDWKRIKKPKLAAVPYGPENQESDSRVATTGGRVASVTVPQVAAPSKGGKVIHMTVHAPISVHAAPGEDPNHTHHKTGEAVHRHVQAALERAAQGGGG